MGTTLAISRSSADTFARLSLKASVWLWFAIIMAGQLIFAISIALFYGIKAGRGDLPAWNRTMTHGYVPGQPGGNLITAIHIASAAIILTAGTLQLIPQLRTRLPRLHRWTGRLYILSAYTLSLAGLYMIWVRGTVGDFTQHFGNSILAVLIMAFAFMAIRQARARKFESHRRWAIRLFILVSASLFIRAWFFLMAAIGLGFDPATATGPLLSSIAFAQFIIPLGVFEIYLRVRSGGAAARMALAGLLVALTLSTAAGLAAVTAAIWLPDVKAAFDPRRSMTQLLAATITSRGIESAIAQYNALKASQSATYDFDEPELNSLGYTFLRLNKFEDAIRIFQLNIEEYPASANTYDSLAEAYMDAGNKPLAIANYQQSVDRNPKNVNAANMIVKLKAK